MERGTLFKMIYAVAVIVVMATVVIVAFSSGGGAGGDTRYCVVTGCPNEAAYKSNYCFRHECANPSCTNPHYSNGYCKECLERALK